MEFEEACNLEKRWAGKPCNHSHIAKESWCGMLTGDYVCTTCGEAGYGKKWNEEIKATPVPGPAFPVL